MCASISDDAVEELKEGLGPLGWRAKGRPDWTVGGLLRMRSRYEELRGYLYGNLCGKKVIVWTCSCLSWMDGLDVTTANERQTRLLVQAWTKGRNTGVLYFDFFVWK